MRNRCYSELKRCVSFEERFDYLSLGGVVGTSTFGHGRWANQNFYCSREWKRARHLVILRDNSCDLGVSGYEIYTDLFVHHMNPVSITDLNYDVDQVLDPEFLITTSRKTHNAIHFSDATLLPRPPMVREPNDTRLW